MKQNKNWDESLYYWPRTVEWFGGILKRRTLLRRKGCLVTTVMSILQKSLFAHKMVAMNRKTPQLLVSCLDVAANFVVATISKTHTTVPNIISPRFISKVSSFNLLQLGELETNHPLFDYYCRLNSFYNVFKSWTGTVVRWSKYCYLYHYQEEKTWQVPGQGNGRLRKSRDGDRGTGGTGR